EVVQAGFGTGILGIRTARLVGGGPPILGCFRQRIDRRWNTPRHSALRPGRAELRPLPEEVVPRLHARRCREGEGGRAFVRRFQKIERLIRPLRLECGFSTLEPLQERRTLILRNARVDLRAHAGEFMLNHNARTLRRGPDGTDRKYDARSDRRYCKWTHRSRSPATSC